MTAVENEPPSDTLIEADEEVLIRPLLARANLLRMRRQWDEAVAVCTEALRRAPRSANAHSLLGDIYDAQGKFDDAVQWYAMAIELAPQKSTDRVKLERLLGIQRARLRTLEIEAAASAPPPARKAAGGRTLEWFGRIFPPGRSEGLARLILAVSISIAFVVALCAVMIYFFLTPHRDVAAVNSASEALAWESPSPVLMTPTVAPNPVSGMMTVHVSREVKAADAAAALRPKVAQAMEGSDASLTNLVVADNTVTIDLTLFAAAGETMEHLRERAVRGASLAAHGAALSAPAELQRAYVRVALTGLSGAATTALPSVSLFAATTPLHAFHDLNIASLTSSDLQSHFDSGQWNAATLTAVGAANASPAGAATPSPAAGSSASAGMPAAPASPTVPVAVSSPAAITAPIPSASP